MTADARLTRAREALTRIVLAACKFEDASSTPSMDGGAYQRARNELHDAIVAWRELPVVLRVSEAEGVVEGIATAALEREEPKEVVPTAEGPGLFACGECGSINHIERLPT